MTNARLRPRKQRSPREWALRGSVAVAALLLAYVSTTQTLAVVIAKSDVQRAHALAPGDGRATAKLAEQLVMQKDDAAQRARAGEVARQALIDEPLAVPALTALALETQLRGNTTRARQLFEHSDDLSRRELSARLWLIEDAVGREDVPGALRHYDIALRTSRAAPEVLFPVLSNAIGDPAIATALANTLATGPAWGGAFLNHLGNSNTNPTLSANFMRLLVRRGYAVPEEAQVKIINALVATGKIDEAWSYYASLRKQVDSGRSRDPDFAAQLQVPSVFDWVPVTSEAGVSASIQRAGDRGIFDFAVPATVGGVVLQQIQRLAPGRYRLEGTSSRIEQASGSRPYWQLACADGRDLGRVELTGSTGDRQRFAGEFTVTKGCAAQTLRLVVKPSSEVGGVSGQIERVLLAPVGQGR
jgi:hypothetical protein